MPWKAALAFGKLGGSLIADHLPFGQISMCGDFQSRMPLTGDELRAIAGNVLPLHIYLIGLASDLESECMLPLFSVLISYGAVALGVSR